MMTSLQDADPLLKEYFIKHALPQIYKALLAGLCVSCPEDPLHFIEEKILEILENQDLEIDWHTFIDDDKQISSLAESMVFDIFGNSVDLSLSHLFEKAYYFYRNNLTKLCFMGWRSYIMVKREEAARQLERMKEAEMYHTHRGMKSAFIKWTAWIQFHKQRQNDAVRKLHEVQNSVRCRIAIAAWRHVVQNAKRTREYFKRIEREIQDSQNSPLDDGQDRLSMLPSNLSLKIFQSLGVGDLLKCAQVCRSWKSITQVSSLWRKINFSSESSWITDKTVEKILRAHRLFVLSLDLCGCTMVKWPSLRCISECKNIQELNLSECPNVNDEIMRMILKGCHSLLSLDLGFTSISNGTINVLSRCCLMLQSLSLAYCVNFSDKGLQYLTTGMGCHHLSHLDLSGCSQISVNGFTHIADACCRLQHIVLDHLPTMTDACMQVLVSKCHMLTEISLLNSSCLCDVAFKAIAEVSGNNRITDSSWRALCRSCPKLSEVHASDCPRMTDISMKSLGGLRKLCSLNISDCINLTDTGIRYITDGPSALQLQELDLSNCTKLTDLSFKRIAQKCTSLTRLTVCYCETLSDNGFECLASCTSLYDLDITGCNIQDQGLAALGSICSLKKLTASECVFITDHGIEMFCRQSHGLELLDLCHCVCLSDRAIKALSLFCTTIDTVRIAGCHKMTDIAVKYLTKAGHFLRELDVSGCPLLTDRTPSFLLHGCPKLQSIRMLYCKNISKQAALKLQGRVQQWKHSTDDAPYSLDQLLQLNMNSECLEIQKEDDTTSCFSTVQI